MLMLHTLMLLGLNTASADSWQADDADILIDGSQQVLVANSLDSGWMPANGTVQIRFQVDISQDATITGEGRAGLDWDSNLPGEVALSAQGLSNTGSFSISGMMDTIVSVKVNTLPFGIGTIETDLFSESIPLSGEGNFSPFSWNNTTEVNVVGDGSEVLDYSTTVAVLATISLTGEIRPNCVAGLTENHLSMEGNQLNAQASILNYDTQVGDTTFAKNSIYAATVQSACDIQLVPTVSVSALSSTWPLELTQVDLPPVSQESVVNIQTGTPTFYLASADVNSPAVDFGSIEVGDNETTEIIVQNVGAATLEGTVSLQDDSGAFEVFGSTLNVAPNTNSSIVVSFDALDENQLYEANLVLNTNDPAQPVINIPLSANTGAVEDGGDTNEGGDVDGIADDGEKQGCSTATGSSAWFWLSGLALIGFRRTRR